MKMLRLNDNGWMPARYGYRDFDDLFSLFSDGCSTNSCPACPASNIIETKDGFRIELSVPGFEKKDFHINVENDYLTISSEKEEKKEDKKEEKNERYTRKEFVKQSFNRSYHLSEWVDSENIQARYENGILSVEIPKRDEAKAKPSRQIEIS
ncbi:MAG: Hsp20/alpha crystallin family protein [Bacteroidota bacterium]